MKKTFAMLCFGIALALAPAAEAQRFEWAKGYSSWQEGNFIKGTVTDNEGNLYILGGFRNDATWDGELLLPMAPYGPWPNNHNVIIAKISPDGEMLWKKVVHSNNGMSHVPQDIKKVGDSAFACMVQVGLPWKAHYTYYLDTLLRDTGYHDYPARIMYLMQVPIANAFIMFDFDGNVKEQHILNLTYTDYNGEDIFDYNGYALDTTPWYCSGYFYNASFDIDGDGNIFISGCALGEAYQTTPEGYSNTYDVQNGTIRGIKFWVDNRVVGYYPITGANPMKWYPQLVKFAPHFDTLLGCRYVIQGQSDSLVYTLYYTTTRVDSDGNVYHMSEILTDGFYQEDSLIYGMHENTLIIDPARDLSLYHCERCEHRSFAVQYDNDLNANWIVTLDDSLINCHLDSLLHSALSFHDISFDNDSGLFFISASNGRSVYGDTSNFYSVLMYRDSVLNLKSQAFVMAFKTDTVSPTLHSYVMVPAALHSEGCSRYRGSLVSMRNRIIMQHRFTGGLRYPNLHLLPETMGNRGLAFSVFDYEGNVIMGEPYHNSNFDSRPGSAVLQDSVLYLTFLLVSDAATLGDVYVPAHGHNAVVAKYVDTSFMTTYVRPNPTGILTTTDDNITLFPNPSNSSLYANVPGKMSSACAVSLSGIRIPLAVDGNMIDISNLHPGIYIIEIMVGNKMFNHKIVKR